jgi:drug/metabolite transporter (DMT)-like permease
MDKKRNISFVMYVASLLIFGSNGIVASLIDLNGYETALFRTALGCLTLLAAFFLTGQKFTFYKHKKQAAFLVLGGVGIGVSQMALYEAYHYIGVSITTLLYYCGPVLVMVLAPVLFKERLEPAKVVGFLAVLVGVMLVNGQLSGGNANTIGIALALVAAAMYAVMVIPNRMAPDISGLEISILQLFVGSVVIAAFVGVKQGFVIDVPRSSILPILVIGLGNAGLGNFLFYSSIRRLPLQTVSVCGYLEPLSAVLLSALILKEAMAPVQITGAVLILGGAIFAETFHRKKHPSPQLPS